MAEEESIIYNDLVIIAIPQIHQNAQNSTYLTHTCSVMITGLRQNNKIVEY
jgi:hypothetical protein